MRIRLIRLQNWLRYRGFHQLELEPKVYGVEARATDDGERSNWIGKSSLLEAVAFAFFGWHRWPREDDWITHGEEEGLVQVECDDLIVQRMRKRGRSTQLIVAYEGKQANQAEAQRLLEEAIGFSEKDFFASCFFRQKQMGQFVTGKSSERLAILSGWFGLEQADDAEEYARSRLSKATGEMERIDREAGKIGEQANVIRARFLVPSSVNMAEWLEQRAGEFDSKRLAVHTKLEGAQSMLREAELSHRDEADWKRVVEIDEHIAELEAESTDVTSIAEAREHSNQTRDAFRKATEEVERRSVLAHGQFDGRCPVDSNQCPVQLDINRRNAGNAEILRMAEYAQKQAYVAMRDAAEKLREQEALRIGTERRQAKIEALRAERENRKAAADRYLAKRTEMLRADEWTTRVEEHRREEQKLAIETQHLKDAACEMAERSAQIEHMMVAYEAMEKEQRRWREAMHILRQAIRQYAEAELGAIERGANALLVSCGVPLVVSMLWEKEASSGLAAVCDGCGTPFPSTQKVKLCERCGAARGPKMIPKLDVVLSDRSGAAEDLAGVAVQLAAAAWLRMRRTSAWSVAFLDEPFGSLDGANRKALATHVATMLKSEYGFEQAFVVAHQQGVVDAMPGRIVIVGEGTDSRIEGVS